MPYAVQYDVPGDEALYGKITAAIGPKLPPALRMHLVAKAPSGRLRHIEVWDNAEEQERFQRERVGPAIAAVLRSLGIDDVADLPERETLELVDCQVPAMAPMGWRAS
ncbi:hypothetical protein [Angustibacter luteus]|uniref:ABM domain-containing protein n=1 Tax=Angustibacter luteus TaxID=658456 RepID=A0ABW1JBY7_9ACTN